jgi:hypothetical protein
VEVETNRYPVPFAWCRAQVCVELTPTEVRIVHEAESIVYERELEHQRVIRWSGEPRALPRQSASDAPAEAPRFDPAWLARVGQVAARPLDAYAALVTEVMS